MQRYFINNENGDINNSLIFDLDIVFHLTKVMRSKNGDQIILCNLDSSDNSNCFIAEISNINKTSIEYIRKDNIINSNKVYVDVLQGLPKGNKIDDIIKNLTHLGVNHLFITEMDRSNATLKNVANKQQRYEKIINQSASLSHRFDLMKLSLIKSIKEVNYNYYNYVLIADEDKLEIVSNLSFDNQDKILIIIGPEGGISNNERQFYQLQNAIPVSLGNYILPTELAGFAAVVKIMNQIKSNNK